METLHIFESAADLSVFHALAPGAAALTVDEPSPGSLDLVRPLVPERAPDWLALVERLRMSRLLTAEDVEFTATEIGNETLTKLLKAFVGVEDTPARLAALIERAQAGETFQAERVVFVPAPMPSSLFRELAEASGAEYVPFETLEPPEGREIPDSFSPVVQVGGGRAARLDFIVDNLEEGTVIQARVSDASRMFLRAAVKRAGVDVLWAPLRPLPTWMDRTLLVVVEEPEPLAPLLTFSQMGKLKGMDIEVLPESFVPSLEPRAGKTVVASAEGPSLPSRVTTAAARGARPSEGSVPTVHSASSLETYAQCPAKYAYKYRDGIEAPVEGEDAIPLILGSATHRALELAFRESDGIPEKARLIEHFQTALAGQLLTPAVRRAVEMGFENFAERIEGLEKELVATFGPLRRKSFEQSFSLELGKDKVRGRLDRVDVLSTGAPLVLDYKTGSVDFTPDHAAKGKAFQAFLYLLSNEDAAGILFYGLKDNEVRRGIFLEERLPKEAKKKLTRGHALSSEKWAELKAQALDQIAKITGAIARREFAPTPSREACEFCEYGGLCRVRFGGDE